MTFLTPGLALLAAGIGVPVLIALHILKLRRLPQKVPSSLLWRRSVQDLEANVPFQKLRVSWLFVLQMLALLCASLAAGQPIWRASQVPDTFVVVLDARARMGASIERPLPRSTTDAPAAPADPGAGTDAAPDAQASGPIGTATGRSSAPDGPTIVRTRFDRARERARSLILDRTGPETEVHLVLSRATPGLIASGAPRAVLEALARVEPTDEPGDADDAMELAAQIAPDGELVWIGDDAAARSDNVGITILSAQRSSQEPGTVEVLITAVNAGASAVEVPLLVTLDANAVTARLLRIPAADTDRRGEPGRASVLVRVPQKPGALLDARLTSDDALPIDDVAAMRMAPRAPLRVAFARPAADSPATGATIPSASATPTADPSNRATAPSPLEALLGVMDMVSLVTVPCDASREVLEQADLIVADGCMPRAIAAREVSRPWLVFAAAPSMIDVGGSSIESTGPSPSIRSKRATVAGATRSHPIMQGVGPFTIDIAPHRGAAERTVPSSPPSGVVPLLVDGDEILATIDALAPGVHFRFDLSATDWPADPSWVMTMQNAVLWLAGDEGDSAGTAIRTGAPARVLVQDRNGARAWVRVPARPRVGSITVRSSDGAGAIHPVSLLDESQSDLRPAPAPEDPRRFERNADRRSVSTTAPRPLWPWLAIAALALLSLEWVVYVSAMNADRRPARVP